jgi:hypothetical protein
LLDAHIRVLLSHNLLGRPSAHNPSLPYMYSKPGLLSSKKE